MTTQTTTCTDQSRSHRRPPGQPKYVLEEVDVQSGNVCLSLRREVLWSVAHLFQKAETHLPGEDVSTLKELGDLIEVAAKAIFGIIYIGGIKPGTVETVINGDKVATEFDTPEDSVYLHMVDLDQGFVRLSLVGEEILLAGRLLQGIFTYLDDGQPIHGRPEPRAWGPLRSLGNKLLKVDGIFSGNLDVHEYREIADEVIDADGEVLEAA